MTLTWLAVEPLDTVMVRDGRPFDAGSSNAAQGVPPPPNTLGGVAMAALRRDEKLDRIIGPFVAVGDRMAFPAPADLVEHAGSVRRLTPVRRDVAARTDLDAEHRLTHHLQGVRASRRPRGSPRLDCAAGSTPPATWRPAARSRSCPSTRSHRGCRKPDSGWPATRTATRPARRWPACSSR